MNQELVAKQPFDFFPGTRYMGSKNRIINEIWSHIKHLNFESFYDGFAGSNVVGYYLKCKNKRVITNDFLKFSQIVSKAVIENSFFRLDDADIKLLLQNNKSSSFIQETFQDVFFDDEDNKFLDSTRSNIDLLSQEYKKALALAALVRACIKKRSRGIFTFSGQRYNDGRRDMSISIKEHFLESIKAYNEAISSILSSPQLSKFAYVLCVEEDNTPPADGLLKLYKAIQNYDVVGGLYWIKGEGGVPMIWGDPKVPDSYVPQQPIHDTVQECNGLGMGFTLFRLDMFRNPGFEYGQWFKTVAEKNEFMTQDLWFFRNAKKLGYRFACDTSCKVGHYDALTGTIW